MRLSLGGGCGTAAVRRRAGHLACARALGTNLLMDSVALGKASPLLTSTAAWNLCGQFNTSLKKRLTSGMGMVYSRPLGRMPSMRSSSGMSTSTCRGDFGEAGGSWPEPGRVPGERQQVEGACLGKGAGVAQRRRRGQAARRPGRQEARRPGRQGAGPGAAGAGARRWPQQPQRT
jgi:hypothetical protein